MKSDFGEFNLGAVGVTFAPMGGNLYWYKLELLFIIGFLVWTGLWFFPGLVDFGCRF